MLWIFSDTLQGAMVEHVATCECQGLTLYLQEYVDCTHTYSISFSHLEKYISQAAQKVTGDTPLYFVAFCMRCLWAHAVCCVLLLGPQYPAL